MQKFTGPELSLSRYRQARDCDRVNIARPQRRFDIDIADEASAECLMMVLESSQYVEKDSATGKYRLGSRIIQLGLSALSRLDIYEKSKPHAAAGCRDRPNSSHRRHARRGSCVVGKRGKHANHSHAQHSTNILLTKYTRNTITSPLCFT